MTIIIGDKVFNINQRVCGGRDGETYWRVSLTTNAPLAIGRSELVGLAMQLDLTQAEVEAVLGTAAFPPQLVEPGVPPRRPRYVQWAYKPAVAALLALGKAKLHAQAK
ncbi:hypothetical protein LPC10_18610 [Methylorubrum sp. B1-46]|uniref:hypothetical protein n=1 Tax=Methylorubrum sp. B1-46 TaxID=2897334 RepID=UPI001E3F9D39|nr:hypothetical protein [Methylorubrum sp. B1-46]UGB24910.1 hypothetical protein LPC10_18610 [Methylorubrum sp. B1-46]